MERLWGLGSAGQPPEKVRVIALTNQIAVFAGAMTVPYQLFYLARDAAYYAPVVLANLLFLGCYLSAPVLNACGRFGSARTVVLGSVYLQLIVVTAFVGNGAGVHLFYFVLGGCLGLVFIARRLWVTLPLMGLAALLFLVSHFRFPSSSALLEVPPEVLDVMYVLSATGAVSLAGAFSLLFRTEIDRAELALTRSNEDLERLSGLDSLTGLANRRALDAYLARELPRLRRSKEGISLLMCDVDAFKEYNDRYGHLAGDACLQRIAQALSVVVGRSSDLVARYGGEEFAIVLPATAAEGAGLIAEEARKAIEALGVPHESSEVAGVVTISIGVASAEPEQFGRPEDLLRRADSALYEAKRNGRNRVERWRGPVGGGDASVGTDASVGGDAVVGLDAPLGADPHLGTDPSVGGGPSVGTIAPE